MDNVTFFEIQRLWNYLWYIMPVAILIWIAFIRQIIMKIPFGQRPTPNWMLILLFIVFGLTAPFIPVFGKMTTSVDPGGLHVRIAPLMSEKTYTLDEIAEFENETFDAYKDYGGYGIRLWRSEKAYLVSGNTGVKITLTNGKEIMIGSKRPEEFASALEELITNK